MTSDAKWKSWNNIQIHKGYLPLKESLAAQSYVVLAATKQGARATSTPSLSGRSADGPSSGTFPGRPVSPGISSGVDEFESDDGTAKWSNAADRILSSNGVQEGIAFYLFHKKDVSPPPLKYTISPKQVNSCFVMCEKVHCSCECPHVKPDAWRLRVDTLHRTAMNVSGKVRHRRLRQEDIVPTAGYFFVLGLLHLKAVQAAVPTMCRFNETCKHGSMCLYIHGNVDDVPASPQAADVSLRTWYSPLETLTDDDQQDFFDFIEDEGISTLGDIQVLGVPAFEQLAGSVPSKWAEAFLVVSTLRNLDRKSLLGEILPTFPRIRYPVALPETLRTVGALLDTPSRNFYRLDLLPHVMNACEIIRCRYEMDEEYNVITLSKEPPDSFFVKVTSIVNNFRAQHAHCSWRKHDPSRPVVTSVFAYVDVSKCDCVGPEGRPSPQPFAHFKFPPLADIDPARDIGIPRSSWCTCPRYWEIAVNYELSTPSGSRCSEQNAMGKLAAAGVPTWALRDIFVHGTNSAKEANPLFPCGVCENMLQKVNKDVMAEYGGDVCLYMFDATHPKKVVHLPVPEISHRDGSSFKKFVAEDLREHS